MIVLGVARSRVMVVGLLSVPFLTEALFTLWLVFLQRCWGTSDVKKDRASAGLSVC